MEFQLWTPKARTVGKLRGNELVIYCEEEKKGRREETEKPASG